jgi:hypothetical protein
MVDMPVTYFSEQQLASQFALSGAELHLRAGTGRPNGV